MNDRDEHAARHWRERLTLALAQPLSERAQAPVETQGLRGADSGAHRAAVLIPVVGHESPFIYFTQRSGALSRYPGQISFPGGRMDAGDASPCAAALREAEEEIGLAPDAVTVLGELPEYRTGTGFVISPFVGWVDPAAAVAPDHCEVARLFGVPLSYALDHRHFRCETITRRGHDRLVYVIDYAGDCIWGATAGMLYGLLQRLAHVERREAQNPMTEPTIPAPKQQS